MGASDGAVPSSSSGRTRMRRMAWIFGLTVAVRIVYFMVMVGYTADWDPKPIQRNGFLTIAQNVLDGEGFTTRSLLTYYPAGQLVPTAARSPLPIVVFAGALRLFGPAHLLSAAAVRLVPVRCRGRLRLLGGGAGVGS